MSDPWTFGWTQLLTIIGFLITIGIAVGGFRTFSRWRREKIEERKIDVALEALSIAYEAKYVFGYIRSVMAFSYEWKDMPQNPGETESQRNRRGAYYAPLKRIDNKREFFERVSRLQPRFMAIFGLQTEEVFRLLQEARREVEVASEMLMSRVFDGGDEGDSEFWKQMEADIWVGYGDHLKTKGGDQVTRKIEEFQRRIEALSRPVIDRTFGRKPAKGLFGAIASGFERMLYR